MNVSVRRRRVEHLSWLCQTTPYECVYQMMTLDVPTLLSIICG